MMNLAKTRLLAGLTAVLLMLSLAAVVTSNSADAVGEDTGGVFVPVTPTRLVDTSQGIGGPASPIGPLIVRSYEVLGHAGVPSTGVSAVVVNVAVTNASTGTTNLTVWPTGESRPDAVTMYYSAENSARSNTTIVKVGTGGKISVRNLSGNTDVTLDIQGYFTSTSDENSAGGFVPIAPVRVADSTTGVGVPNAKLAGQSTVDIQVSDADTIPSNATAVFANVEVQAANTGELIIVKGGESVSNVPAAVAYQDNGPTSSGVMLRLSSAGKIRMHNAAATTTAGVDYKVDIQGYFSGNSEEGGSYTPIKAAEIYNSTASGSTALSGGETRVLSVGGIAGIPTDETAGAAVLSLSVRNWTASGNLTAFNADDHEPPETTNLSFIEGAGEPSIGSTVTAIVPLSADGQIKVRNSSSNSVTFFVAAQGWFTQDPPEKFAGATFEDGSEIVISQESGDTVVTAPTGVDVATSEAAKANDDGTYGLGLPTVPAEADAPSDTNFEEDPSDVPESFSDPSDTQDLPNVEDDEGAETSDSPTLNFTAPNAISIFADVPQGYRLYGTNRVDSTHYRSRTWYVWEKWRQNGHWVTKAEAKLSWKQTLNGGTSTLWNLDTTAKWVSGWDFDYHYTAWCGVVRINARDHTCRTDDSSADPYDDSDKIADDVWGFTVGTNRWYNIGYRHSSYAKYPLVRMTIDWDQGGRWISKARGWDTRHIDVGWRLAGVTHGDVVPLD